MGGFNHLPLLSLLTITVLLLLSIPCPATAYPKRQDYRIPKTGKCAQYDANMERIFLRQHNRAREQVGVQDLVWDDRVANYARWYAEQRRSDCKLIHSHGNYGENIFWGSGACWPVKKIVHAWVVERKKYDYQSNTCRGVCGHYTQIVWRNTTRLGCAVVICDGDQGMLAVCNYDAPGNYVGMWPY